MMDPVLVLKRVRSINRTNRLTNLLSIYREDDEVQKETAAQIMDGSGLARGRGFYVRQDGAPLDHDRGLGLRRSRAREVFVVLQDEETT